MSVEHSIERRRRPTLAASALGITFALLAALTVAGALRAQTLVGSPVSLERQNQAASEHAYTYLRNPDDIEVFLRHGLLVRVPGNRDYEVDGASFPYARPEVARFLSWIGRNYREECGEPLVATSLVRPKTHQPRNASIHSVHPTGMAMDLRRSNRRGCRDFLESTLLDLEGRGVLEATRERYPAHYHVALFPDSFTRYAAALEQGQALPTFQIAAVAPSLDSPLATGDETATVASAATGESAGRAAPAMHRVRAGETMFRIAKTYGVAMSTLRAANGLRSDRVFVGQQLRIPGGPSAGQAGDAGEISIRWSASRATAAPARTVRVASGDTLSTIARRHGTTVESLKKANGLRGTRVQVGQRLKVPGSAPAASARPARATATKARRVTRVRVHRGETLWDIAQRHGVSVASLRKANRLSSSTVKAGQILSIPAR